MSALSTIALAVDKAANFSWYFSLSFFLSKSGSLSAISFSASRCNSFFLLSVIPSLNFLASGLIHASIFLAILRLSSSILAANFFPTLISGVLCR